MSDETKLTLGVEATEVRISGGDLRQRENLDAAARYREHGVLGRGGMGEVKLVADALIGREIAVKTMGPDLASSAAMRERFLREVRIQGQLEHPAIVPVYDIGVDSAGNDYFTMKRITGRTLAEIVRGLASNDPVITREFPRNGLLATFRQVCLAIAYAHTRGVIHRDLKPANIMVGDFGEVYVLDWGIARLAKEELAGEETSSEGDDVFGTPGYMPPEQIKDARRVDERADVYALGAILFELLALERLHRGASATERITETLVGGGEHPAERAPELDIPPELDELCARALAAARDDRPRTARELADAVERYLEGDRDLERRRAQALQHAAAAREARARIARGDDPVAARREALREAGRAIALDPEGRDGVRVAVELMLEPPAEVPAEVVRDLERAQSERVYAGLTPGIAVFALFTAAALLLPAIGGAVSWRVPIAIASTLFVGLVLSIRLRRSANLARERGVTLVIVACVAASIAMTTSYLGPLMLVPPLAVALVNSLTAAHATQPEWRWYLGLCILAVTVPFVLEWTGVIPSSYVFSGDAMLVRPVVHRLDEVPVRFIGLATTLVVLIGSAFYVRRVIVVETALRKTWLLHNWHLRHMAQITTEL